MLSRVLFAFFCWPVLAWSAATHTWPTDADCSGTLQDCINSTAAGGDTVLIASNGPIDETLSIGKPLTLTGAPGYRPVFSAGHKISGYDIPNVTGSWSLEISGLTLLGGDVGVRVYGSSYTATIVLRDLDVTVTGSTYLGAGVGIDNFGGGALIFDVANDYVTMNESLGQHAIAVTSGTSTTSGSIAGSIHDNRIAVIGAAGSGGIQIYAHHTVATHANVYANQISGKLGSGVELSVYNGFVGDIVSNVVSCNNSIGTGISAVAFSTGPDFQLFNNTTVGCATGVYLGGSPSNVRMTNDLIAYNTNGVGFNSGLEAVITADHNLLFANTNSQPLFNPGSGSLSNDPGLRGVPGNARLNAGSPAIDAGNTAALLSVLGSNTLPLIDAEGLRRVKGASNAVDIGAFEYGDVTFLHQVDNSTAGSDNFSFIDNASINGDAARYAQITANWNPDLSLGIYDNHPVGLDYDSSVSGDWYLRTEDLSLFPDGARFNIFAPAKGSGNYQHVVTAGNISGFTTELSDAGLTNHSDRILLVTRDSTDPNTTIYDDPHPFGLLYSAIGGTGHWFVLHLDSTTMFAGGTYHVYWQEPSMTAFTHRAYAANSAGDYTVLDHPLLNGHACARFHVTQSANGGVFNNSYIGVFYSNNLQRWAIFNQNLTAIPANAEFHVVIDGQQTFECTDVIFANGFD